MSKHLGDKIEAVSKTKETIVKSADVKTSEKAYTQKPVNVIINEDYSSGKLTKPIKVKPGKLLSTRTKKDRVDETAPLRNRQRPQQKAVSNQRLNSNGTVSVVFPSVDMKPKGSGSGKKFF